MFNYQSLSRFLSHLLAREETVTRRLMVENETLRYHYARLIERYDFTVQHRCCRVHPPLLEIGGEE